MHPHFSGDVGQYFMPVIEFDAEHRIRQRFGDRAFQYDGVILGLCQSWILLMRPRGGTRVERVRPLTRRDATNRVKAARADGQL